MTRVLFLDRGADAGVAAAAAGSWVIVAATNDAATALERRGLPFQPLGTFTRHVQLASIEPEINRSALELAVAVEAFVAERAPDAPVGPEGFLRGHRYHLQYSLGAIVSRTLLHAAAIDRLGADEVAFVRGPVDPWFSGSGYSTDPWIETLAAHCGVEIELLDAPAAAPAPAPLPARASLRRAVAARVSASFPRRRRRGPRLLAIGSAYDWTPVFSTLDAAVWTLDVEVGEPDWAAQLAHGLRLLDGSVCALPRWEGDAPRYGHLVDAWLAERARSLTVAGVDVIGAATAELRALAEAGPGQCREADAVANAALDVARPDAVTSYSLPWLVAGRLVERCRDRGIPVICYQHGGSFGTHRYVQHEQTEFSRPDVFLSYGDGIRPATSVLPLPRARFVPVGSARAERLRARRRPRRPSTPVRALWIGTLPTRNVLPVWLYGEETERAALERRCLERLARSEVVRIAYRPFPGLGERDGVEPWLADVHPEVRIADGPMRREIEQSDLVLTTLQSSTVWNEVIALGRPLVLHCDPRQTPLTATFDTDLDAACVRCHDDGELLAAVGRLADEGPGFVEAARRDTDEFLARYVLHREDGRVADRAAAAVRELVSAYARARAAGDASCLEPSDETPSSLS